MTAIDRESWQQLEPLLDQAIDLPPAERSLWLAELSARSPALASQLISLLAANDEVERSAFLAGLPEVSLAGLELGAYKLVRPLGQGGMGTVWLATRSDGRFEGFAAVKLLNLALLSAAGRERFRREGSVLASLAHPGIARLLDAGVNATGQPFLVLEYVDGLPIDDYAREHGLTVEERVRLFLQVLAAVGHAHAHLIVHRDLKPSNILVTGDGTVKLLDFGIAKLLDGDSGGDRSALTLEGGRVLTPKYAAPEQVRDQPLTTATDVYALGVLLYLLLSGRHPTAEDSSAPAEDVRTLLEVEPARLHLGDLDSILDKSLRKLPAERYQTVAAFSQDLERYLRKEPVSARPHSAAYRVGKFIQRNRSGVFTGAVAVVALLGATIFSLAQMKQAEEQRDTAVRERRRANAQVEFQNVLLSSIGDRPMTMREIVDEARDVLEDQSAGDWRTRTALLLQLAGSYREMGDTKVREELLLRAESLAVAGRDLAYQAQAHCDLGDLRRYQGRHQDAWRELARGDSLARAAGDPAIEAICQDDRSVLASETLRGEEALRASTRAVAIRDSLGETHDGLYLDILTNLGNALDVVGRSREGSVLYRRVIAAMDSSGRGGTLNRAIMGHNLATVLLTLGERAEAEDLFYKTVEGFARGDRSSPIPFLVVTHYAEVALSQGRPDSALKYSRMAAAHGVADSNRYQELRGLVTMVRANLRIGRLAEAERAKRRADSIRLPPETVHNEGEILDRQVLAGWVALARGDHAFAKRLFMAGLRANGYYEGKQRTLLEPAVFALARCHLALGEPAEALKLAREARVAASVDSVAELRSARVGEARLIEARALLAGGDSTGGRASIERAVVPLATGAGVKHPITREAQALAAALDR
jgi:tetratricopeptide (TPR) repeat protein